jgi:hypothetical protein
VLCFVVCGNRTNTAIKYPSRSVRRAPISESSIGAAKRMSANGLAPDSRLAAHTWCAAFD